MDNIVWISSRCGDGCRPGFHYYKNVDVSFTFNEQARAKCKNSLRYAGKDCSPANEPRQKPRTWAEYARAMTGPQLK